MKLIVMALTLALSFVVLTGCCNKTCTYKDAPCAQEPAHHDYKGEK